jgi:peptidoglycan/LPS O-acetylase OafA/YrhL
MPINKVTTGVSEYRPDIDGLRAISVLSVIFFHIEKSLIPGGFAGVDIFFVISGFLISRNIIQNIDRSRFSIYDFYIRRIRRIIPAMAVVVAATLLASYILMIPEDAATTSKSAVWSLGSAANIYFWLNQDLSYFATDSRELPLLHLWSLGVEEQFYLIWPIVLLIFYKRGREKTFTAAIIIVSVVSFLLGDVLFPASPSFAYYMLPTRAGELLLGAIVAAVVENRWASRLGREYVFPMAVLGAGLVLGSLFLLSEDRPFPGFRSLFPTAGAAFLILAGSIHENPVSKMLSFKPLVGIGLVSYSAYLWHWPLLAFARYGYGELTAPLGAMMVAATFALATASYYFVEQPGRRLFSERLQVFAWEYVAPVSILIFASLFIIYSERLGFNIYSAEYKAQSENVRKKSKAAFLYDYVCQRQMFNEKDIDDPRCIVAKTALPGSKVLLWGDSNASHYVGMIGAIAEKSGFQFRNLEIGSCPPISGDPTAYVEARRISDCKKVSSVMMSIMEKYDVIIISASWNSYHTKSAEFMEDFSRTVSELAKIGKMIIIIGKTPIAPEFDRRCQEKALKFPMLVCGNINFNASEEVVSINGRLAAMEKISPHVRYFDVVPYLCNGGVCSTQDSSGDPKYYDRNHLSLAASWNLGREMVAAGSVPEPFQLVAGWASRAQAEKNGAALAVTGAR